MTDYKALCAELYGIFEKYDDESNLAGIYWDMETDGNDILDRARAALAQPEPEGPSKAELRQIFDDQSGFINDEQVMWWSDFQHAARTVLARWGSL
jgi:hypothetical protein